jgi:hypothetical protein
MKDKKTIAIILLSLVLAVVLVHDFLPRYQEKMAQQKIKTLVEQYKVAQTAEQKRAIIQEVASIKPRPIANTTEAYLPIIGSSKGYAEFFCYWLTGYAGRRDDAPIGGAYDECMRSFEYGL